MSRRLIALPAALLALTFLAGCGDDDGKANDDGTDGETTSAGGRSDREPTGVMCEYPEDGREPSKPVEPPPTDATVSDEVPVTFETSVGTFNAVLDAEKAPCTVNSFVSLADQGYFDDTSCHRMTTAGIYVLQCGDPTEDPALAGTGGPGYTIADEVDGTETYEAGTLAMAKTSLPDSGGSQFFIVYDSSPLPPDYTVFGTVDDATVELVKGVADGGVDGDGDGPPLTPVEISSVVAE